MRPPPRRTTSPDQSSKAGGRQNPESRYSYIVVSGSIEHPQTGQSAQLCRNRSDELIVVEVKLLQLGQISQLRRERAQQTVAGKDDIGHAASAINPHPVPLTEGPGAQPVRSLPPTRAFGGHVERNQSGSITFNRPLSRRRAHRHEEHEQQREDGTKRETGPGAPAMRLRPRQACRGRRSRTARADFAPGARHASGFIVHVGSARLIIAGAPRAGVKPAFDTPGTSSRPPRPESAAPGSRLRVERRTGSAMEPPQTS